VEVYPEATVVEGGGRDERKEGREDMSQHLEECIEGGERHDSRSRQRAIMKAINTEAEILSGQNSCKQGLSVAKSS